jgi:DICT domain-containing protein
MDLRESIAWIRHHEKELSLFNIDPTDPVPDTLRTYFETQHVEITVRQTASGAPEDVAVLSDATGVLALVDVSTLREIAETDHTGSDGVGIADATYASVLRHLKETTFTSHDTEQLLYASREVEDRARRVGGGSIHAGFQRCSAMKQQRQIYADLARRGLSVHAYGVPDTTPPDLGPAHVHAVRRDEIAQTWFVVFDGDGDDSQKSALLAEERDENDFYGAWTYDPGIVDPVLTHLERTYDSSADNETTPL